MAQLFSNTDIDKNRVIKTVTFVLSWIKRNGFKTTEIRFLMKDIFNCLSLKSDCDIKILNQELETLGWGIEIIDESIYKQMVFLSRNLKHFEIENYLQNESD